jgi:hypothetical protein
MVKLVNNTKKEFADIILTVALKTINFNSALMIGLKGKYFVKTVLIGIFYGC